MMLQWALQLCDNNPQGVLRIMLKWEDLKERERRDPMRDTTMIDYYPLKTGSEGEILLTGLLYTSILQGQSKGFQNFYYMNPDHTVHHFLVDMINGMRSASSFK